MLRSALRSSAARAVHPLYAPPTPLVRTLAAHPSLPRLPAKARAPMLREARRYLARTADAVPRAQRAPLARPAGCVAGLATPHAGLRDTGLLLLAGALKAKRRPTYGDAKGYHVLSVPRLPHLAAPRPLQEQRRYLSRSADVVPRMRQPTQIIVPAAGVAGQRQFHVTPCVQGLPLIPLLAGILKTSTMLEVVRTAARIALTFVPVILIKNHKVKRKLKYAEAKGDHAMAERVRMIRHKTVFFHVLLFVPVVIFWATIAASLERTPLTGRWRLILLSPEEEDDISAQLAGPGWYHAVGEILSQDGSTPSLIAPDDWRLGWVQATLRRLESVIPLLQRESELDPRWLTHAEGGVPLPPPAAHPLKPRPRASEYMRMFAEMSCGRTPPPPAPHAIAGPPYSLIVVDRPDSSNAFSYGFGPDGGGGIVVFSGFLDDVLSKHQQLQSEQPASTVEPQQRSWLQALFGGLYTAAPVRAPHPQPTEEQTSELAILLAHELSHLILSHHLETLSSGSIIWPGILSITTDIVRAVLFPITMLFGPFVNDALASMGKIGSGEFTKLTEYCTSQKQEIEADIVSIRLLAHAGFDPRHAVSFWEGRAESERTAECSPQRAPDRVRAEESAAMRWVGASHPMHGVRTEGLRRELERWEAERVRVRRRLGMDEGAQAPAEVPAPAPAEVPVPAADSTPAAAPAL